MVQLTPAQRMEQVIRTYIQAYNAADAKAIAACFCSDAAHYLYLLNPPRSILDAGLCEGRARPMLTRSAVGGPTPR
jgi:hypothetical protein